MSAFAVIYLHDEVQKFLDQVGTVGNASGAKYYVINGNYYCATNEPNIFIIPNRQNHED